MCITNQEAFERHIRDLEETCRHDQGYSHSRQILEYLESQYGVPSDRYDWSSPPQKRKED